MLLLPFCYSSSSQFSFSWKYPRKAWARPLWPLQWTVWARKGRNLQFPFCWSHQNILLPVLVLATVATSPCTQLPAMTLQASSFSRQSYKNSSFFHWANLHFPVGNTALRVYHSLNKLGRPRKIKVHNRCSFEVAWDSQWWKRWNNSSFTRFVQHFHGKEPVTKTTRERPGTPDKFPATFHGKGQGKTSVQSQMGLMFVPRLYHCFLNKKRPLGYHLYITYLW